MSNGSLPNGVRLVLEEITPERALDLLVKNTNNRNIRQSTVDAYARDIRNNHYLPGQGEPIHIDPETGEIGNGQHRLLAVIETETTILTSVLYAPISYRKGADQGIKRTFGDVLKIEYQESHQHAMAAAVRYLWDYRRSGSFGNSAGNVFTNEKGEVELIGKPTVWELEEVYLAERNGLRESLVWIPRMKDAGVAVFPSLYVALDYIFRSVEFDDAEDFANKIWKAENLDSGHPILSLRRVMRSDNPSRPHRAKVQSALIIKTWNAYRNGEQVHNLAWRAGGSIPEAFPAISGANTVRAPRRRGGRRRGN